MAARKGSGGVHGQPRGCSERVADRVPSELKVWRDGRGDPLTSGLPQLDGYLDGLGLATGWLVIFDQRSTAEPTTTRTHRDVAERLDWSTLRLEPGSYVEEALRESMSDLLFSIRFQNSDQRALAYLLWEHMHSPHRLMPLRMVNYGGQALRDYTQRTDAIPGYLPVLLPVVIVQSGQWSGPRQLSELHVLSDEPGPRVFMDLEMIVHELRNGSIPPGELTTLARTTLRLLRLAALDRLVASHAARITRWLGQVHRAHGYDDYRALLEYILRAGRDEDIMDAIIERSDDELRDSAMSIADRLEARGWARGEAHGRAEGEARGRVEGEAHGRALLLLRQLEHRFGRLAHPVEARVLAARVPELEAWALRLLDARRLDEVFERG